MHIMCLVRNQQETGYGTTEITKIAGRLTFRVGRNGAYVEEEAPGNR